MEAAENNAKNLKGHSADSPMQRIHAQRGPVRRKMAPTRSKGVQCLINLVTDVGKGTTYLQIVDTKMQSVTIAIRKIIWLKSVGSYHRQLKRRRLLIRKQQINSNTAMQSGCKLNHRTRTLTFQYIELGLNLHTPLQLNWKSTKRS